jgi:UDP:flavonoid glycosyltransferase YjiC (YdhE family)
MADILFVTWDGGGNVPPALGIADVLAARGHSVRFLGHRTQTPHLVRRGVEVEPNRHAREFSALAANSPLTMMATFADRGMGKDLLAAIARRPADLVVIDCLMFGAMDAARAAGLNYVVLEHLYDGYYRRGILGGPMGLNLAVRRLRPQAALAGARARIVTALAELDDRAGSEPGLVHVGPVVTVAAPAPEDLVLVSLSTFGFAKMQQCLQAIADATADLGQRVVVTTGPAIDPADLRVGPHVEVHRFVPHVELMSRARLFVGHGGHGSTMQALAHDLPMALMPMDRMVDQPTVAASVQRAGAARTLRKGAAAGRIAPVLAELLADGPHHAAAARLGAAVRAMPGAENAATVIQDMLTGPARGPLSARP